MITGDMPELKTRDEIRAWLEGQPRDVIAVFAARAALRAVPAFHELFHDSRLKRSPDAIILPSLWAMATALSAGINPDRAVELSAAAATAAYAAHAAAAHAAAYAAHATAGFAAAAAITYDSDIIAAGGTANDLACSPLWPGGKTPNNLSDQWDELRQNLLSLDPNWSVWTDWYEARLRGAPLIEAIDIFDPENGLYGRVTFPSEVYENPTEHLAKLKAVIDEYWAGQLEQDAAAETFELTPDYNIVSSTQVSSLALTATPEQREWYEELKDAVSGALTQGENALGPAHAPLRGLAAALPAALEDGRVPRVWRRANNLRRVLDAHDRIAGTEEFSQARLSAETADAVRDVVETFNNFRIGDAGLMAVEQNAPSPQETESQQAGLADITPLIEDAIEQNIVQGEAVLELTDIVHDLSEIEVHNRIMDRMQAEQTRRTFGNFMRPVLSGMRKLTSAIGISAAARAFLDWVTPHAATIIKWVSEALPALKDWIAGILTSLL